jgi:excisionase family DNA binding protein
MTSKTEIPNATRREPSVVRSQFLSADRLLTINEVSELTGLAVGTLYHFVSQKRIPVVRLSKRCIRFRQVDLSEWIQTLTHGMSYLIQKEKDQCP